MMKKVRLLMMILVALMVAQVSNAQVAHEIWWEAEFSESNPGYLWGMDEAVIGGSISYHVNVKLDTKTLELKKIHIQAKATTLIGESHARYKYQDIVAQGKTWNWPTPSGGEVHYVGHAKVIKLGEGVTYSIKVHFIIAMDKDGNLYFKKEVIDI